MKAGFGWEIGAFETWDVLGIKETVEAMKNTGYHIAEWVSDFTEAGNTSFYKIENGKRLYYDVSSKKFLELPGGESFIILSDLKEKTIWKTVPAPSVIWGITLLAFPGILK